MSNKQPSLRFDHREIAVIFSLFVFVSLLMFTVGILVGKGITQAKFEGNLNRTSQVAHNEHEEPAAEVQKEEPHGEEVAAAAKEDAHREVAKVEEEKQAPAKLKEAKKEEEEVEGLQVAEQKPFRAVPEKPNEKKPLELLPEQERTAQFTGGSLKEPTLAKETDNLLKDPKIRALLEQSSGKTKSRSTASVPETTKSGLSFATGDYTVQVGSYPTEKDAQERVENLKKLGFQHSYYTAKDLGDGKEVWYRVWLGYFPDYKAAKKSGDVLQQKGEVRNYLVRKKDISG